LGGQRVNTILNFHVDQIMLTNESISFAPGQVPKHSRRDIFLYRAYNVNKKLCIVDCFLKWRAEKTPKNVTQLIVTHRKPHKAASGDTIRRWIQNLFADTKAIPYTFTAHSCRSA